MLQETKQEIVKGDSKQIIEAHFYSPPFNQEGFCSSL